MINICKYCKYYDENLMFCKQLKMFNSNRKQCGYFEIKSNTKVINTDTILLIKSEDFKQFLSFFEFENTYIIKDADSNLRKIQVYIRNYETTEAVIEFRNDFGEVCENNIDVILIVDNNEVFSYGGRTYKDTERLANLLIALLDAVDFEDISDYFVPLTKYNCKIIVAKRE